MANKNKNAEVEGTGAAGKSFLLLLLGGTVFAGLGKMVLDKIKQDKKDKLAAEAKNAPNQTS
jgi:ABC-type uncharacterized transport system ATPase component